ncbi:MAG: hypothetical protein IPJ65_19390 [Archangiaceae bacterium]|nr:hypothetical protein [Archangiaceae bacterium]
MGDVLRRAVVVLPWLLAAACSHPPQAIDGTQVKMSFERADFWDAPFPSDELVGGGRIDLTRLPTRNVALVGQVRAIAARSNGFATTGAIFFALTDAIDPARLPTLAQSVEPSSPVQLVELGTGKRYPFEVSFQVSSGPYGTANHLVLLPLQGVPLAPATRYAAVVKRTLAEPKLGVSQTLAEIAAGTSTLTAYVEAARALGDASELAGLAVFTTGRPTDELAAFAAAAAGLPTPGFERPFARTQLFADYCVYESTVKLPNYQRGAPPYSTAGGTWPSSPDAGPDRYEEARAILTVPRAAMPAAGWPLVDFIGTGAGGERALYERGVWGADGGLTSGAGSGPAMHFARAGFAGLTLDGPLWGARNLTHGDEDLLYFNLTNLPALRDNLRQAALELTLHPSIIAGLTADVSDCPGASPAQARVDLAHLAIWGHSMGASILPLGVANAPGFKAVILSGAGASWVENLIYKRKPVAVKPFAEVLAEEPAGSMTAFDPLVTLVQWAAEVSDAQVYAPALRSTPVLMEQGIVDHYILPRIANALSLPLRLDLAGPAFDDGADAELADQLPLDPLLQLSGARTVTLPAEGHVVVQHRGDGVLDAHEVIYQLEGPQHQYRCFLKSWVATGRAVVPGDAAAEAPCD